MGRKKLPNVEVADEGEEWVLSYADMMSLLLCFFIMLYTVGSVDAEKMAVVSRKMQEAFKGIDTEIVPEIQVDQIPESKQARAFQLLVQMLDIGDVNDEVIGNIEKKYREIKNTEVAKERMLKDMGDEASGAVSYLKSPDDLLEPVVEIVLPESMLFSPGKAELSVAAKKEIQKIADGLAPMLTIKTIQVVGHTDSRTPSKNTEFSDNWTLSSARAGAVARELTQWGLDIRKVEAIGRADSEPLFREFNDDGSANLENMAKNRRVEIKVRMMKE